MNPAVQLLAMAPLASFAPGVPKEDDLPGVIGLSRFCGDGQTTDKTCWAAVGAAVRRHFGFASLTSEQEFAEAFWAHAPCPDRETNTTGDWRMGIHDVPCMARVAEVFVQAFDHPELTEFLDALRRQHPLVCALAGNKQRHAVVVYSAYKASMAPWLLNSFDPDGPVWANDLEPEKYLACVSVECGRQEE